MGMVGFSSSPRASKPATHNRQSRARGKKKKKDDCEKFPEQKEEEETVQAGKEAESREPRDRRLL